MDRLIGAGTALADRLGRSAVCLIQISKKAPSAIAAAETFD
jgi:hypothetical protein